MTQRRHGEPLPLGDDDLPYSKGVMARALIAAGVPADRAYQLARRVEVDLAERGISRSTSTDSTSSRAEMLGDDEAERAIGRLRRLADLQSLDVPIVLSDRRLDRHGQVDRRCGGRPSARHHTRRLDRLHPPDDARVLLPGVHADVFTSRASRRARHSTTKQVGDLPHPKYCGMTRPGPSCRRKFSREISASGGCYGP